MSSARAIVTLLAVAHPLLALTPADRVVTLQATPQISPPALILAWEPGGSNPTGYQIQRKPLLTAGWTTLATLPDPAALAFVDSNVVAGVGYEYKVTRFDTVAPGWGFLYAAIDKPPVRDRGTLILAVESGVAADLAPELERYELDLAGDGWQTVRLTADRAEWNEPGWSDAVTNLKAQIQAVYDADPASVQAILLFGHLPVPYSGDGCYDGHLTNHYGAWPADPYYGDVSNRWSDVITSTYTNQGDRLKNLPGDGKFDPTLFHSYTSHLAVGRIDLAHMPAFPQSETELLRRYLAKARQYRAAAQPVSARGLVCDDFPDYWDEAFAQNGWRDFGAFFGPSNVQAASFFPTVRTGRYHAVHWGGFAGYTAIHGKGSTADFASGPVRIVFAMMIGSYFGDWDYPNSLLRAPLASAPSALAAVWAGRPQWYSHPLDLGEPIGTVYRLLHHPGYADYVDVPDLRLSGVQAALMGDPTLRLRIPAPPRNLGASATASQVVLSWLPADDAGVSGYEIARTEAAAPVFSNRLADCHPGTAFTDTTARAGAVLYRIRSIKREVVRSGSYTNLGHGRFVKISADHQVNRPPVVSNRLGAVVAGQAIVLTLAGNDPDGDPIRFALADWPATGLLTGCPPHLVYQSVPDTTGTVVFTYDASDGVADSDPATITLTLAPVHTRRGTPGAWLIATIGFTNDYEQADADDPDGDRQPTWMEYRAGTDPRDSRSRFTILSLDRWEGSNRIRWYGTTNSGAHTPFTLDRTESLATVDWRAIATNLPRHPSGTNTWFDTNQTSRAFYRIFIP